MSNNNNNYLHIALPAIAVALMLFFYFITNTAFVKCGGFTCRGVDQKLVSRVSSPLNLNDAANKIGNINTEIGTQTNSYKEVSNVLLQKQGNLLKTQAELDKALLNQATAVAAGTNSAAYESNIKALEIRVNVDTKAVNLAGTNANSTLAELKAKHDELKATSDNISARYTKRLFWLFLSAIVFGFTVIGIGVSIKTLTLLRSNHKAIWILVSIGASLLVYIIILIVDFKEVTITESLFKDSMIDNGDISATLLSITNSLVFPVIVFFAIAAGAIIYSVKRPKFTQTELNNCSAEIDEIKTDLDELKSLSDSPPPIFSPPEAIESRKTELENKLAELRSKLADKLKTTVEFQEELRNYSKLILYVGSVLIFAGLTRINILNEWHQLFVAPEYTNALSSFFKGLIAVQGGFYSMLLAGLYLPMAFAFPPKEDSPNDFTTILKTYIPRFIALILPFFSGTFAQFFNFIGDIQPTP